MVIKGQLVGLDWNRIARLHSQVMNGTHELTDIIARSHKHISLQFNIMLLSFHLQCTHFGERL